MIRKLARVTAEDKIGHLGCLGKKGKTGPSPADNTKVGLPAIRQNRYIAWRCFAVSDSQEGTMTRRVLCKTLASAVVLGMCVISLTAQQPTTAKPAAIVNSEIITEAEVRAITDVKQLVTA